MVGDPDADRPRWAKYLGDVFITDTICRITTQEGLTGVGGSTSWSENQFDASMIETSVLYADHLIGRSALDREALWKEMSVRPALISLPAMSIIDIALWDLAAKYANLPIYQLLGASKDKTHSYASAPLFDSDKEYMSYIQDCINEGFTAIKIHPYTVYDEDVVLVDQIQDVFAGKIKFMLDADAQYSKEEAYKMGNKLDEYGWEWFEAPFPDRDLDGYMKLVQNTNVPISCGSNIMTSLQDINNGIKQGAWTEVRTDITASGGFTSMKKIVALAEANNMRCELQSWGTTLTQAANLHMILASNNCSYFEQPFPYAPFEMGVKTVIRTDSEGFVQAPKGNGLGIELDWQEVERLTIKKYDIF